jgi:hypothetical protein
MIVLQDMSTYPIFLAFHLSRWKRGKDGDTGHPATSECGESEVRCVSQIPERQVPFNFAQDDSSNLWRKV